MAARKNPSNGGKPDKVIRDALMLAVKRETTDENGKKTTYLNRIVAKVVQLAAAGDGQAFKEVFDRLDGRPAQSMALGQDPSLEPLQTIVRPPIDREAWLKLHGGS